MHANLDEYGMWLSSLLLSASFMIRQKSIDLDFKMIMQGSILQALKSSKSIEVIYVPLRPLIVTSLAVVVDIPTLKAIEVKDPMPTPFFQGKIEGNCSLANLVRYQTPSHTASTPILPSGCTDTRNDLRQLQVVTNPFYSPMSSVSLDIQDGIWSRILMFALEIGLDEENTPYDLNPTRASLPLVSKKFNVS
jgi:hypothetical protein